MTEVRHTGWYAVRVILQIPVEPDPPPGEEYAYEERITLWRADSHEEAIERATIEAVEHSEIVGAVALDWFAQTYNLPTEPGDGAEIFSLIRGSELPPERYVDGFFATGREYLRDANTEDEG